MNPLSRVLGKHQAQFLPSIPLMMFMVLVLGLVVSVSLSYQQFDAHIRSAGSQQASLLARMDVDQLSDQSTVQRILQPLSDSSIESLAYILIEDSENLRIQQLNPRKFGISALRLKANPSDWYSSRELIDVNTGSTIVDFSAPILSDGKLSGFVRVGYQTGYAAYFEEKSLMLLLSICALLLMAGIIYFNSSATGSHNAGPISKLTLLTNLLPATDIKRIDQARNTSEQIDLLTEGLIRRVNQLKQDRFTLHTSAKVLAYQKSSSESILRSIPEGVVVLDETGSVTYANKLFLLWYQLEVDDVIGKLPYQWCEQPEILKFFSRYRGVLVRKSESGQVHYDPPGKPGAHIQINSFPVFSSKDEGTAASTLIVFSDVTKLIMVQDARDEFSAALAHELKTPLHAIGMFAEALLGEECAEEQYRIEYADMITTEVEHVTDLVRNMLNITRIETGNLSINRKTTKLNDLLNSIAKNLASTAEDSNVTIKCDIPEGMDPVYLDKDLLRIAINNLVSNGIKYNRDNGEVRIEIEDDMAEIKLIVSDTGIGIDDAEQGKVFDKFYRSEDELARAKQGNGLGLSLVKEIVELHGGTIDMESVKGAGSQFVITLKKLSVPLSEAA